MGFKGVCMHDSLLDSIEEHAKLFVVEHPDLPYAEMHEYLESAVARGLVKFDTGCPRKPEVREGERVQDDPARLTHEAADRVLSKLHKLCLPRTEFDD